jgi:hypothetical protein
MRGPTIPTILVVAAMALHPVYVSAFETDQYNLPHVPLADIGDEVSEYVEQQLVAAIENVNKEIDRRKLCVETTSDRLKGCSSIANELEKLAYLRSGRALADEFADLMAGDNLMTTKFGGWIHKYKFRGQPDRYKTSYSHSIFILNPANYATISPTVRLYGVEFGIDKLEHFFQQGYQYYEIERKALAKNATAEEALKKAIEWGKKTERTYYGLLSSGVYSNADLYANYVGLRFYKSLTNAVRIGEATRPPVAVLDNGYWKRNPQVRPDELLKPFVTEHLNEALNPSAFRFTLVRSVRRAVKKYACEDWRKWHSDLTAEALTNTAKELETLNGENYGWTRKSHTVRIGDECLVAEARTK